MCIVLVVKLVACTEEGVGVLTGPSSVYSALQPFSLLQVFDSAQLQMRKRLFKFE